MNNTKHTPGPWVLSPDFKTIYSLDGLGYRDKTVARLTIPSDTNAKQARADLKLFAAAPELLEALDSLADAAERGSPDLDAYVADARAAIKKAKGE